MKNRGFTLVELFAVIIILGILGAISTAAIIGHVNKVKKEAVINSAEQIIKSATISYTTNDNFTTDKIDILSLDLSGSKPEFGYIQFDENEKVRLYMLKDGYCVIKDFDSEVQAVILNNGDICNWDTIDSIID